ncbi:MAG TPA: ABC transporter substrate-binding protein [Gaiellaceae bacterium]|nr:ABC transporter substrate-binding protein [Gaiellaceae bacterium]
MKRLLPVLAVAALVAIPSAGATRQASPPTLKSGQLTVGLNPPAVGFQVGTLRGNTVINPTGFEIDLARAIAAKLGIAATKISWVNIPFTTLFRPGSKPFDFAFEEATITTQRKQAVDFSAPYFDANQGVLMKKGAPSPTSLAALKALTICGQADTTGLDYVQHQLHATHIQIYNTTAAAFSAVQVGRCDAFVMDVPIIASQKKTKPGAYGPIAGQIVTNEQYGAVLAKGSKLTPLVSAAVKALTANGTIAKLQQKWFAIDVAKIPVLK